MAKLERLAQRLERVVAVCECGTVVVLSREIDAAELESLRKSGLVPTRLFMW